MQTQARRRRIIRPRAARRDWCCPRATIAIAALLSAFAAGCVQPGAGSELIIRPQLQNAPRTAGEVLRVPTQQAFAIRSYDATRRAEIDGEAAADAAASPGGKARATASVRAGGEARSVFQLGHALRNDSSRQIDLVARVRVQFEYEASSTPAAELPDAVVQLNVFARDARNRLVRSLPLVSHSTEQGDASSRGAQDVTLVVTLGPGESATVFVGGGTTVNSKAPRNASARVEVTALEMEFESRPAPAVNTSAPASAPASNTDRPQG